MIKIELKSSKLQKEDVIMGQLYVKDDTGSVYMPIETMNPRWFVLYEIGKQRAMTPYETLEELHRGMVSYGLRKGHFKITEIGESEQWAKQIDAES